MQFDGSNFRRDYIKAFPFALKYFTITYLPAVFRLSGFLMAWKVGNQYAKIAA